MAESIKTDVVIIGAGISGLTAAKLLQEAGYNFHVVEARDRVGGRTLTKRTPEVGNYVDLGGSYVGVTQNRLHRLAKELNLETYKVNEKECLVHYRRQQTVKFSGSFPPMWNPFVYMDYNNIFRTIDQMGREIPPDAPWEAPRAQEWDRITVAEFINKTAWTSSARTFARAYVNVNVCCEPYECSLLWFLWYINQCGGTMRIFSTTNGGQERKFKGGSQQICERLAERLKGKVKLNSPVCTINQNASGVVVKTVNGDTFEGRYVIVAIPPILQTRITFDPPQSALRNQMLHRCPMGTVIKTFTYYKRAFWRENGMCGSSCIEDEGCPIGFTLDDTKPDGSHPAIMGFILADKARRWCLLSREERRIEIAKHYAKVFQSDEGFQPIHYEEMNWMEEQWTGGCYTMRLPPGFLTTYGRAIRPPFGRLYFAGTETATEWSGYMEGAIQAGERAAREILHAEGKIRKEDIWQSEAPSKDFPYYPFVESFMERNAPSVPGFLRFMAIVGIVGGVAGSALYCAKNCKR